MGQNRARFGTGRVGATLVVARPGTVQDLSAGRHKGGPYRCTGRGAVSRRPCSSTAVTAARISDAADDPRVGEPD